VTGVTQSEFAKALGVRKSYVTKLKQAGRLVLDDRGRVLVDESRQRIEATRDPNRDDVVAANAARRAAVQTAPAPPEPTEVLTDYDFPAARARKEHFLAQQAELEYRQRAGELLESAEAAHVVAEAATYVRTTLESLPDRLAPQVAHETDEHRIHALLAEDIEHTLRELSRRLEALTLEKQNE